MRRPLVLSLFALAHLGAAELPVTHVTVLPDGMLIECRGTLPAGERVISGLPLACRADSIGVSTADGLDVAWRMISPAAPALSVINDAAISDLAASSRAAATAGNRSSLAGLINDLVEDPVDDPANRTPALTTPEALAAHLAFAAANAQRASTAAQAAADAAAAARARLASRTSDDIPIRSQVELNQAHATELTLRYRLDGATWQPAWRIELDSHGVQLVQLARLQVDEKPTNEPALLTVTTYGQQPPVLLPEPRIPLYGLTESMALEHPADPLKPVPSHESKGSEWAISQSLESLKRAQSSDGSWYNGGATAATTALSALVFLGSGYDHKTLNKYRGVVRTALTWMQGQKPTTLDLPSLALTTSAQCEMYAMTADPQLKATCELFISELRQRFPRELAGWCARDGALAGPEVAALVVGAFKSSLAGGLDIGDSLAVLRDMRFSGADADELRLATAWVAILTGQEAHITTAEAQQWAASASRWLATGRCELVNLAVLSSFQQGGEVWRIVNDGVRDLLVHRQDPDGLWTTPYPLGRLAGSLWCELSLEVYYRYSQIRRIDSHSPVQRSQPAMMSRWPMRLTTAKPVRLSDGVQEVELRRVQLPETIQREAIPAQSSAVWRVLEASNPWPGALPPGPLTIVADGRIVGSTSLAEIAPGGYMRIPLGVDDSYRIRREVTTATDDGLLSRTLTVTVTCTLEASAGATDPVTIREALPEPGTDAVKIALTVPEKLSGDTYRQRLKDSPFVALILTPPPDPAAASAKAVAWSATFTYARAVRPRLETR